MTHAMRLILVDSFSLIHSIEMILVLSLLLIVLIDIIELYLTHSLNLSLWEWIFNIHSAGFLFHVIDFIWI